MECVVVSQIPFGILAFRVLLFRVIVWVFGGLVFDFVFDLGLVLVFCISEIWSFAWLLCQFAVCLNCDFVGLCKFVVLWV